MFEPGTIIAGKYRVERVLGVGGMGIVVAAVHRTLGTHVALKFLHREMFEREGLLERFVREAQSAAQLRSEHVCRVTDVDTLPDGSPYFVMEMLVGADLAQTMRDRGPVPSEIACDYLLQACVGIAEAHARGVIHRDLKPANLFLSFAASDAGTIKVLDFGVAKVQHAGDFSLTQTASVVGSPGYMSPEQLRSSRSADVRSDIWSLGVTLYELLSGRMPWQADTLTELTIRVVMDPLPPLPATIAPELAAAISRCLEKDPAARFADVAELAQALAPHAGPRGPERAYAVARMIRGRVTESATVGTATVVSPPITRSETTLRAAAGQHEVAPLAPMTTPPRAGSRRLWTIVATGVVAVAVAVVTLAMMTKSSGDGGSRAPVASQPIAVPVLVLQPAPTAPAPTAVPVPVPVIVPPVDAGIAPADAAVPAMKKPPRTRPTTTTQPDINDDRF